MSGLLIFFSIGFLKLNLPKGTPGDAALTRVEVGIEGDNIVKLTYM